MRIGIDLFKFKCRDGYHAWPFQDPEGSTHRRRVCRICGLRQVWDPYLPGYRDETWRDWWAKVKRGMRRK